MNDRTICTLFQRDFEHLVLPAVVSHLALPCRDVSSFGGVCYALLSEQQPPFTYTSQR